MSTWKKLRTRPRLWASAGLVTVGLASGAIIGSTMTASASTATSASNGTATAASGAGSSTPTPPPPYRGLPKSGTVTAVGTSSVTIDGTTYAVTSSSDIDKNGEATLASLKVGDKVTFNTVASASTPTIDKLHAGNEALDRPSGPRPDGGMPPAGAPAASGSTLG